MTTIRAAVFPVRHWSQAPQNFETHATTWSPGRT